MSIDKKIDYVAQDGVKNYVKNSPSVTVPKNSKLEKMHQQLSLHILQTLKLRC